MASKQRTVLIIEDDHETRVALRDAFEEEGYTVFSAANGRDGLDFFRALRSPFVVLLDQNLPILSGDEILAERSRHPDLVEVPVIVMSAVAERTRRLGATAFVPKPLDVRTLVRLADACLEGKPPAAPPSPNISPDMHTAGSAAPGQRVPGVRRIQLGWLLPGFSPA